MLSSRSVATYLGSAVDGMTSVGLAAPALGGSLYSAASAVALGDHAGWRAVAWLVVAVLWLVAGTLLLVSRKTWTLVINGSLAVGSFALGILQSQSQGRPVSALVVISPMLFVDVLWIGTTSFRSRR